MWLLVLIAGAAAVFIVVGRGGRPVSLTKRLAWTLGSVAAAGCAVWTGLKGLWLVSIMLMASAVWLGAAAERSSGVRSSGGSDVMSVAQARAILGVGQGAASAEIEAAYRRLMLRAHPDQGGSAGLAAQLNAARDRLLKKS